jgi:LemA protein
MRRCWLALLAPLVLTGCGYNRIQELDEEANRAKGNVEVALQRRADLIPNLVATVKGYAAHEEAVFTNVANARTALLGAVRGGDPEQMANANAQLSGALSRLIAISEAYPELKANENFLQLQDNLAGTENRIATARSDYNEAARNYNTYIRRFPAVITAKATGAKTRTYFEVTSEGAREAPTVDFSKQAPAGAGAGAGAGKSP